MSETTDAAADERRRVFDELCAAFHRLDGLDPESTARVRAWVMAMTGQAEATEARLKAQSRQMRRLEMDNEYLRGRVETADLDGRDG